MHLSNINTLPKNLSITNHQQPITLYAKLYQGWHIYIVQYQDTKPLEIPLPIKPFAWKPCAT